MIDIKEQVTYWRNGAIEDMVVSQELVNSNRVRHGLFFAHLALEKMLKAHVCSATNDLAPRIHNLVRLVELTSLQLSREQIDILAEMNAFNLEGRYPEVLSLLPTRSEALGYVKRAGGLLTWLQDHL